MDSDELNQKYALITEAEEAEEGWKELYDDALTSCMHLNCTAGEDCQVILNCVLDDAVLL